MSRLLGSVALALVLLCSVPAEARGIRQRPHARRPQVIVVAPVVRQAPPARKGPLRRVLAIPGKILRRVF